MTNWHQLDAPSVLRELMTDPVAGLTKAEATSRLAQYGRNELAGGGIKNPWLIQWDS
jgi:hypothetical protein